MNKLITLVLSLVLSSALVFAQDGTILSGETVTPSDNTEANVDSLLKVVSIFETLPYGVIINQSHAVRTALDGQIIENAGKKYNGFRVRLFLSSAQNARESSASVYNLFTRLYPDVPAYRVYDSPNFRVTVGNFRTRLEADAFAKAVKVHFPSASVMRERFKYPTIGRTDMTARDTTAVETFLIEE